MEMEPQKPYASPSESIYLEVFLFLVIAKVARIHNRDPIDVWSNPNTSRKRNACIHWRENHRHKQTVLLHKQAFKIINYPSLLSLPPLLTIASIAGHLPCYCQTTVQWLVWTQKLRISYPTKMETTPLIQRQSYCIFHRKHYSEASSRFKFRHKC